MKARTCLLGLWAALAIAGHPSAAQAATFVVNSTADAVDAAPGNGSCATAGALCTLRAAIQEANALAGGDLISLPAGTYLLTLAGVGEDAAATGDLDVSGGTLTITGAGAASTIVDGGAIDRVLHVPLAATVQLTDLTIRNGNTLGIGGGIASGGRLSLLRVVVRDNAAADDAGISHGGSATLPLALTDSTVTNNAATQNAGGIGQSGALTLNNSIVSDNVAGGDGGGIRSTGTVTVTGGTISGNTAGIGGGIFNDAGAVDVNGATITGNTASAGSGGGLLTSAGTVTLTDTVLSDNQASNAGGGLSQGAGTVTLTGCTVVGNSAANLGGGITGGNDLSVTNSVVMDNTAPFGAGISSGTASTITGTTVSGNDASVSGGGIMNGAGSMSVVGSVISGNTAVEDAAGIFNQTGAALTLEDTTVRDNQAGLLGGGLRNRGTATLERVTLSGNSASEGGGVHEGEGDVTLTNVTLSGNLATSGGGVYHVGGTLTINNGTVSGNTATTGNGGGLGGGFSVTLRNTILAANVDTGGEAPDCSLDVLSAGYNFVGTTAGCNFLPDVGDQADTGLGAGLGPLGDNGGSTATRALLAASPALDAGDPAGCTGAGGAPLTTDQRGAPRPLDGGTGVVRCDIGAFERALPDHIFADGFEPT